MKNLFIIILSCFVTSILYSVDVYADRIPMIDANTHTAKQRTGSAQLGHVKKNIHIVTPVSKKPYTKLGNIPVDISQFVLNSANHCTLPTETRETCFVRYNAYPTYAPAGQPQYYLANGYPTTPPPQGQAQTNENLVCPDRYFPISNFGNSIYNVNSPSQALAYYNTIDTFPVTQTQYNNYQAAGYFNCNAEGGVVYAAPDHCASCYGLYQTTFNYNGYMAILLSRNQWMQDTYNTGSERCEKYELSGCPDWCSSWLWENATYTYVHCRREAGIYPAPNNPPPELSGAMVNARYVPSTIICTKPSIEWRSD